MSLLDSSFTGTELFLKSPLAVVYYGLRDEGYHHNVALWGAWHAHPSKETRRMVGLPNTQKEFAAKLGVSARTIRKYAEKYPELTRQAQSLMINSILSDYLPGALKQMGETAQEISGRDGHYDRKLLFEMTGVYSPKKEVTQTGSSEVIIRYDDD